MARHRKQTVDYFPHDTFASEGRTLTILQNKYGNDGYAFWFRLLEILGRTPGHIYVYRNPADWEFLCAKTHLMPQKAAEILETLSELQAIDPELYAEKTIWIDNFIEGIADAYSRRLVELPQRPIFVNDNGDNGNINNLNVDRKQQRKGKETIGNNTIKIPEWINRETWDAFLEMRKKQKATPTPHAIELLIKELGKLYFDGQDPNKVLERSIMNNWKGIFPLEKGGTDGKAMQYPKGTKLPDRKTGYTEPPPDPELARLVEAAERNGEFS